MNKLRAGLVGNAVAALTVGCSSSAPAPASPTPAHTVASTTPTDTPAPHTPTGHELLCEGSRIRLQITDATLELASNQHHRSKQRWNQISATYNLEAKGTTLTGTIKGVRDADFVFMHLSEPDSGGTRARVDLKISPNGNEGSIGWAISNGADARDSAAVTCTGSLMTAKPAGI